MAFKVNFHTILSRMQRVSSILPSSHRASIRTSFFPSLMVAFLVGVVIPTDSVALWLHGQLASVVHPRHRSSLLVTEKKQNVLLKEKKDETDSRSE